MKVAFLNWLRDLRASYWFLPAVMAASAILLSFLSITVDGWIGEAWIGKVGWLFANKPEGARAVLSTVAGSMVTVAGVTFSMTILTVAFAAGQIGPRLMNNFMRDRGNQLTLGTFIATFLYCLMVLRTVRNAGDTDSLSDEAVGAFVPHLSIFLAMLMAVASVGVLIYFIHHVPDSINVSNVIARVGRDLNRMVDKQFPTRLGEASPDDALSSSQQADDDPRFLDAAAVPALTNGYIQAIEDTRIMKVATRHDLVIRLQYRPGDFVSEGKTLMHVWPADRLNDDVADDCRSVFAVGSQRTRHQNIFFLIDELVEIIARALSPGVNDPFTAITCMDWLQSVLTNVARREPPDAYRHDDDGRLRVIAFPLRFHQIAARAFDQTLPYVSADRNAALHQMKIIAEVTVDLPRGDDRAAMMDHAASLCRGAQEALTLDADRAAVQKRHEQFLELMGSAASRHRLRDDQGWFNGSA